MVDFVISDGSVRKLRVRAAGRGKDGGRVQMARLVITLLLASSALLAGGANAGDRTEPIRIGQLTESWGPAPAMVGRGERPVAPAGGLPAWSSAAARIIVKALPAESAEQKEGP